MDYYQQHVKHVTSSIQGISVVTIYGSNIVNIEIIFCCVWHNDFDTSFNEYADYFNN